MPQVKDLILEYHSALNKLYSKSETEYIMRSVFLEYSDLSATDLLTKQNNKITQRELQNHKNAIKKLNQGMPLQYVLGHAYFHGLKFLVNKNVLIPRPETEELVEWIVYDFKKSSTANDPLSIIDIGTGSGCIAIALKKALPGMEVWALDKSKRALNTAKQNAALNQTEINFLHADITSPSMKFSSCVNIIVSNPPYIPLSERPSIPEQVKKFEPSQALFVKDDPLLFYRKIVRFALQYFKSGDKNHLFLEVHQNYAHQVADLLKDNLFTDIKIKKDMSDNERMIQARVRR